MLFYLLAWLWVFHFAFRWLLILKTLNRRCFFANFYGWNTLKTKFLQLLFRFAFLSVKEQCVSECAYLPVSLWVCVWLPCHCLRLMLLPLRGWHWTVAAFWIIGLARVSHNNTSSVLSVRFVLRRLSLMLRDSTEYNVFLQYLKKNSKIKLHVDHLWSELLQIMFMCGEDVMHTEWTLASFLIILFFKCADGRNHGSHIFWNVSFILWAALVTVLERLFLFICSRER